MAAEWTRLDPRLDPPHPCSQRGCGERATHVGYVLYSAFDGDVQTYFCDEHPRCCVTLCPHAATHYLLNRYFGGDQRFDFCNAHNYNDVKHRLDDGDK